MYGLIVREWLGSTFVRKAKTQRPLLIFKVSFHEISVNLRKETEKRSFGHESDNAVE